MTEEAFAIGLRCGPLQLILGNEVGVTAAEIIATGDSTRIDLGDLPGTRRCIWSIEDSSGFQDALLIVDSSPDSTAVDLAADAAFSGVEGGDVPTGLRSLDKSRRNGILAEAATAAWRQRLSDAADSLDPLTVADAEIVGRLDIPGTPLITELRADRRRSLNVPTHEADSANSSTTVVDALVADLRAAVRYGATGLADATDELAPESIELACERGGWLDRLKLLIAAEEVRAIESVAVSSGELLRPTSTDARQHSSEPLLAEYFDQRRHAEELSSLLEEAATRLPSVPRNPATRLLRRKAIDDVRKLRQTVDAYSSVVRTPSSPDHHTTTWATTSKTLLALERATDDDVDPGSQSTRSIDDAAVLLGRLFADQLPAARLVIDDVTRQHPGADAEDLIRTIKRQAILKLGAKQDVRQPLPEVVAELAMAIAVLRGFDLSTDAEFQDLGRRLLTRADKIAKLQAQAENAIPIAAKGLGLFAEQIQLLVAEYLFHQLGGVKPSHPGAARNVYKTARSKIWRSRRDRDMADAAVGGAADALQRAIDAGAPRLIVRYVDRSLPSPKR